MKPNSFEFMNGYNTVGLCQIEKPHNEKPVARVRVKYLRQLVDALDALAPGDVWLWSTSLPSPPDATLIVATSERDDELGIALAGMREGDR